ncbi:hypothetical protein SNE40_013071 [Patella caerulea]|uniref:Reverse transcriptase domain-containing protein n=1 Tax=Patella caerulea TaxID=87958 RepID=A0AAN8JMU2_PATCE
MGKTDKDTTLPDLDGYQAIAEAFSNYFTEKIHSIRRQFDDTVFVSSSTTFLPPPLVEFATLTEADVLRILKRSKPTTCKLDPVPTTLIFDHLDLFLPVITQLVNLSITEARMPTIFKTALVKPLLKKPGLNSEELKNYRPVSNLPFISKVIERAVCLRLSEHLSLHNLFEPCQSAYRPFHSTESALLRVSNDIRTGIDSGNAALLILLDLSAAFDTINHNNLLSRLKDDYGLAGKALNWFGSYLTDRSQSVTVHYCVSTPVDLTCGVPQGSVLGPVLFTLYTKDLGSLISDHDLLKHFYADDSQIMSIFKPTPMSAAITNSKLSRCYDQIKLSMTANKLKLNDEKTEALLLGPKSRGDLCVLTHVHVGNLSIPISNSIRNLGVMFDSSLNMETHINHISKVCYLILRNIGCIRKYLNADSAKILVSSLILSRIDYCNSLLAGAPSSLISRLQKIQNTAARIISLAPCYSHMTPILKELHFLPVSYRIKFKILCYTFRCLNGTAPKYLSDLLQSYTPARTLRSVDKKLLVVPKPKTVRFGQRTFSYSAPTEWNDLPLEIKNSPDTAVFRSRLKTFLFKKAFNL